MTASRTDMQSRAELETRAESEVSAESELSARPEPSPQFEKRVVIVGGGLAGLAAAVALFSRGVHITLVESRRQLGGRATSFVDPATGELLDNCQHVSMGCCTNLNDFCRRVGIADLLEPHPVLYFRDESGRTSRFENALLPAPLHRLPNLIRARFLTAGDKLRIAYGLFRLMRQSGDPSDRSFLDWLLANFQTKRTCDRFWGVILVSALNESLDRMDYRYARQVFVDGFLANRAASVVEIPCVPLGEFYGTRLERWLTGTGVRLILGRAVERVHVCEGHVAKIELVDGEIIDTDAVVLATPFHRVRELLAGNTVPLEPMLAGLDELESSPITSVHFTFDRPVMDHPHLVVVGRTIQWLFRKHQPAGSENAPAAHGVQAVISASKELAALGREHIIELIGAELAAVLPTVKAARQTSVRVVTERRATFSVLPGVDRLRPSQTTAVSNLFLAGDYTQTGWPATMEGAVISGYLAAEGICAALARPAAIRTTALAPSFLAQLLIRR